MFSDSARDYSTEYNNIFVPVSENENETDSNKKLSISEIQYPKTGEQFGELIIEDCSIDNNLFFGDGNVALRNGVGIYNGSFIPGYGKTILVAGHNNTYFNGLKNAEAGQKVTIKTSYGNYTYEITETARAIEEFTDKVSNWYVRRGRERVLGQRVDGGQEGGLRHAVHRPYDVCQACRAVCAVHYRKHLSESGAQL